MRGCVILYIFFLCLGFFCCPASAIVVSDYSAATSSPTGDWAVDWDYVYNYKNSSAVAVGAHWLLTAAHVADDTASSTIDVNGTAYYQQEIIFHAAADDPKHTLKADLALVRFDKPFPDSYLLYEGRFPPKNRLSAVLIGFGTTGTVCSTYYVPKAYNASPNGSGTKRWGSQKIDSDFTLAYDGSGDVGISTNTGFYMDFDLNDSDYEAGLGTYDSGGGTFVNDNGTWKLAGINTATYAVGSATPDGAKDRIFSISMPSYGTWVAQMIAESDGDDDSDEIPNWWEGQYADDILAASDQDGDGVSGYDEYVADTDPIDSNSVFRIESLEISSNPTLTFFGSTAREYQALYTTNDLADSGLSWATNQPSIWGTGDGSAIVLPPAADKAFYRLEVSLP